MEQPIVCFVIFVPSCSYAAVVALSGSLTGWGCGATPSVVTFSFSCGAHVQLVIQLIVLPCLLGVALLALKLTHHLVAVFSRDHTLQLWNLHTLRCALEITYSSIRPRLQIIELSGQRLTYVGNTQEQTHDLIVLE